MLNALFVLQASLAVAILAGDVVRRLKVVVVDNWADMKTQCEAGYEVSLAQSFEGDSASYPGEIDFSGKVCVIRGNGKTIDAGIHMRNVPCSTAEPRSQIQHRAK
jgi:hypothetical protein